MHGEDAIIHGSLKAEDLLGAEQPKQDAREHEKSDTSTAAPGPEDAAKVHRHHDAESRAAGENRADVI
jgi:hypothetical protein